MSTQGINLEMKLVSDLWLFLFRVHLIVHALLSTHVTWLTLTWLKCSWIDNLCKTLSPSASMIVIIIIVITVSDHVLDAIILKIMWLLCQILGTRKRLNWGWNIVCCLHAEVGRQLTRWSLRMGTLAPNLAHHTAHNGAQWALLILRDGQKWFLVSTNESSGLVAADQA